MTGRYQAYPEYKESGINWLESIPAHWEVRPLKHQSSCNDEVINEKTAPDHEIEYVDIGSVSAVDGISKTEKMLFGNAPSRARRKVQDGDVIVSTVRTYLEAIAPITNPPENMLVSTGFAVIRPNSNFDKGFASYCLRARGFIEEVVTRSVGVSYPAINSTDLINITIPLIPINEQQKIANFLDHETAKIDTLIAKQEKLIELLKEKRQAVISHAITRGISSQGKPNAPMKDSGVEWLGEVPEHWVVSPLKYYSKMQGGFAFSSDDFSESGVQLLKIANVYQNRLALERQPTFLNESYLSSHKDFVVTNGDILMSLTGTLGKQDYGFAVLVENNNEFLLNQRVAKINADKTNILQEYLLFSLWSDSYLSQLYSLPSGTKQANLSNDDVMGIVIAFPSTIKEQEEIVQYVASKLERFKLLHDRCSKKIDLLKERKTALISAAVTGKIDVRNWQLKEVYNG